MTAQKALRRIRAKRYGWVFTPKDFLDLGSRAAVDQALSRLARTGTIRRLGRGLYDYPRVRPGLGRLSPAPDAVARAAARKTDSRLQVSGARAANALGLSTQVPARLVYLTDGRSRCIQFGNQTVELRRAAPRRLVGAGKVSGTVFQALRYLGKDGVDDVVIRRLRRALSQADKHTLRRDVAYVADWMHPVVDRIVRTG